MALQENTDIGRSFRSLATALAQASPTAEGSLDLSYRDEKADPEESRRPAFDFAFTRGTVSYFRIATRP